MNKRYFFHWVAYSTSTHGSCRLPQLWMLCVYLFLKQLPLPVSMPFYPSYTGEPDSPPHIVPFGENWHCPASAAAHGSSRCCHHQRLHSPPYFSQGRSRGDGCRASGGRSLTLTGHKGEQGIERDALRQQKYLNQDSYISSLTSTVWTCRLKTKFPFSLNRKDSLRYM